jgi:hypothetical protein
VAHFFDFAVNLLPSGSAAPCGIVLEVKARGGWTARLFCGGGRADKRRLGLPTERYAKRKSEIPEDAAASVLPPKTPKDKITIDCLFKA